jgi:periplasmic divalent cation tolerance protein
MQAIVVLTTLPDRNKARAFARTLVEEKLAACVNLVPGLTSIYRWQGAVHDNPEVLCVVKTTRPRLAKLKQRLKELHPYHVPELLALPVIDGSEPYLRWLKASVARR